MEKEFEKEDKIEETEEEPKVESEEEVIAEEPDSSAATDKNIPTETLEQDILVIRQKYNDIEEIYLILENMEMTVL